MSTVDRIHRTWHRTLLIAARLLERQLRDRRRGRTAPAPSHMREELRAMEARLHRLGIAPTRADTPSRTPRRLSRGTRKGAPPPKD